jgi:uncharacterized membrane protein (DUF2068 family)
MSDVKPSVATAKHPDAERRALRAIAIFEAVKGTAALFAGLGLLGLLHHDLHHWAQMLISHFGLDPGQRYPSVLLHYADLLQDANRRSLALLLAAYVAVRFAEAYGLWFALTWGEWLAALAGAIYVPFEVRHLLHKPSLLGATVLLFNLLMVAFLVWELWKKQRAKSRSQRLSNKVLN